MNNRCDKEFCIYRKTCLITDIEKIKKCKGKLSEKNPHHTNYKMQVRGEK